MPQLPDTWMTPHEQYIDMLCFSSVIILLLSARIPYTSTVLALGGIIFLCETPEQCS